MAVAYEESAQFAEDIRSQLSKGFGFIPLIGAGLSLASGIPTVRQIANYLFHCVWLALNDDINLWNPRTSKWPPFEEITSNDKDKEIKWMLKRVVDFMRKNEKDYTPQEWLILEAVGSLADWRSTLHFLSRIVLTQSDDKQTLRKLMSPDDRVKDSFFLHITESHQPNLGHAMLAHTAEPLRIQMLLTTNFDDLTEEAFRRMHMPLATFDVHQNAELPDVSFVLHQHSLVKLHGGRYGLRADYSLDAEPSSHDISTFGNYFCGAKAGDARRHLLVLGTSGNDKRVMDLVIHAVMQGNIKRVYWVCHRLTEKAQFESEIASNFKGKGDIIYTQHHDVGALLLEVYQRVRYSLPPSGASYPAFWSVPAESYQANTDTPAEVKAIYDENFRIIKELIDGVISNQQSTEFKKPKIVLIEKGSGISSVAAKVFEELSDNHPCIWLGMDDYYGPGDFFASLYETIASKIGIPFTMPPASLFDAANQQHTAQFCHDELKHLISKGQKPIIVFLHGRNGYGENSAVDSRKWEDDDYENFVFLLDRIQQHGIIFVVLHPSEYPSIYSSKHFVRPKINERRCIYFDRATVMKKVNEWITTWDWVDCQKLNTIVDHHEELFAPDSIAKRKRRFLYAITLFRHARYFTSLYSWALSKSYDQVSHETDYDNLRDVFCDHWLTQLREYGVIRLKPGGLIWMHQDVKDDLHTLMRDGLVSFIDEDGNDISIIAGPWSAYIEELPLRSLAWECHQDIADWYMKLFRSSNDPLAALESIYHRFECASMIAPDDPQYHRIRRIALREVISSLNAARQRILASSSFKAYAKLIDAIKTRVESLVTTSHDTQLEQYATDLHRTCELLLRDVACQVADYDAALIHNKAIRCLPPNIESVNETDEDWERRLKIQFAEHLTGLRAYTAAETEFIEIFTELRFETALFYDLVDENSHLRMARRMGRQWVETVKPSEQLLQLAVTSLRHYLYLQILIAQKPRWSDPTETGAKPAARVKKKLMFAEKIYALTTEIMRHVSDTDFLYKENAFVRTHYSQVLSELKRPAEAHRRLNEAAGFLAHSSKNADALAWAVLDLHLAAIYLGQIQRTAMRVSNRMILFTLLDSTHLALERARERLADQRKDIWWWMWLHEMELNVCVYLSRLYALDRNKDENACRGSRQNLARPLACRRCMERNQRYLELLDENEHMTRCDVLHQAQMANLAHTFYQIVSKQEHLEDSPEAKCLRRQLELLQQANHTRKKLISKLEHEDPVDVSLPEDVKTYVSSVIQALKPFTDQKKSNTGDPHSKPTRSRRRR